ncbi:hypothetical protein [Streptomyces sp. NPDC056987]|uniref:hypothetical protein n=1 Tax=Streptomyces sp. NPDC056987 TaxID=3345988 RepID=UPI00363FD89C
MTTDSATGPGGGTGIAVASGMLKGVFGHGVLAAFEERGLRARVYGTASSSGLSGGLAAIGRAREVGVDYWLRAAAGAARTGMSQVALESIREYGPTLRAGLFRDDAPDLLLATSKVTTEAGAELTQGPGAKRLGRQLLRDTLSGDRSWVERHLAPVVFATRPERAGPGAARLTEANYDAVAYASTRMLHAWAVPAEVDGEPYVDASYTCACPAREVAETGVSSLIVIGSDPFPLYRDLYGSEEIVDGAPLGRARVLVVRPADDLKTLGVDYGAATEEGLAGAYAVGLETGHRFADDHGELLTNGSGS